MKTRHIYLKSEKDEDAKSVLYYMLVGAVKANKSILYLGNKGESLCDAIRNRLSLSSGSTSVKMVIQESEIIKKLDSYSDFDSNLVVVIEDAELLKNSVLEEKLPNMLKKNIQIILLKNNDIEDRREYLVKDHSIHISTIKTLGER